MVVSFYDFCIILDSIGVENLLGWGDMFYFKVGNLELVCVYGVYMSDDDVVNVVDNWKVWGKLEYIESILELFVDEEVGEMGGSGDLDECFDEVVVFV